MNGNLSKKRKSPMSGDTDLQSQLKRLAGFVSFLTDEIASLKTTVNAMHELNVDMVNTIAGLAEQDKALYERIVNLESRRIQLYLGEDSNLCIGAGDWQDRLEGFATPRDFADEFSDRVKDEEEDI